MATGTILEALMYICSDGKEDCRAGMNNWLSAFFNMKRCKNRHGKKGV
jgi:hypothetical protein